MKTINLDEILKAELIPALAANNADLTYNATIRAMKKACEQTIDLCAENAKIKLAQWDNDSDDVDKNSILKTKNQIG